MARKLAAWLATAAIVALGVAWQPSPGLAANTLVQDDFSTNTNLWNYIGSAARTTDGKVMLTPSQQSKVGTLWLKQTMAPPFTVSYKFQMTGVDSSGVGADGIAFMFNKLQNTSPVTGGGMGFEVGNGYGIEFDSYSNDFDPNYNHISLFKDNPNHSTSKPLAQVQDNTFENSQWHTVKLNVGTDSVKVYLDGTLKTSWTGTLDNHYSGIGFTASTGYYYNAQYIDDVVITKPAAVTGATSSLANGAYKAGTVIPIQVSLNDTVTVTGTPLLALNSSGSRFASYVSGSGTSSLTFNYVVQAGDNTNDLNYTSASALTLNDGTVTDSAGNAADLTLPALTASTSLGGAKSLKVDTTGPTGTVAVSGGNPAVSSVTLALSASDTGAGLDQMRFSNDNSTWSSWENYAASKSYALPAVAGAKTVYVQFRDTLGNAGSSTASVTIRPPAASSDSFTIMEDTPTSKALPASDPDGRTITQYSLVTSPSKGTIALNNATGSYTYTPNANVNGTDMFTYFVSDGVMNSVTATVTVTISAINDAPIAANGTLTVTEDVASSGTLTATDVDGPSLNYSVVTPPSKGSVVLLNSTTGAYKYTPNANANGSDSFTFKASDGFLNSNTAVVTVNIASVNDAPVAANQTIATIEDQPANGTLSAADVDSGSLTYSIVTNGNKGTATITNTATGAFSYTPAVNLNGTDTITYRAFDGLAYSAPATVTVTITPVNDAPSFTIGPNENVYESSGSHSVPGWASHISAGPSDEAGQTVHFTVTNNTYQELFIVQPAIASDGTLTYVLADDASGTAAVSVKLQDNGGTASGGVYESAVQTFTINLIAAPLQIRDISLSPSGWTSGSVTVTTYVYSNESITLQKWAPGTLTVADFGSTGTVFSGDSIDVGSNGTYTFYVENSAGQKAVQSFTVSNIDVSVPVIALRGPMEQHIELGSVYLDPGADVTDDSLPGGLFISAISGSVDENALGAYTLTYDYSNAVHHAAATVTRTVYVEDHTPPEMLLNGTSPVLLAVGDNFSDPGVTVTDNSGTVGTVIQSGTVDTATAGTYTLTYDVSDGAGNAALQVSRTVIVSDMTPPIISPLTVMPTAWTTGSVTVSVYADGTGSPISVMKWAQGENNADYFASAGVTVTGSTYTVTENGFYTVYAKDSYGNTAVQTIHVTNIDPLPPTGGISINDGAQTALSSHVTLQLPAADQDSGVAEMRVGSEPFIGDGGWQVYSSAYATGFVWTLAGDSVTQTVYAQYRDAAGNVSQVYNASILIDPDTPAVEDATAALTNFFVRGVNPSLGQVTHNLNMPSTGPNGTAIAWSSDHPDIIDDNGVVTRPSGDASDGFVTLTATVSKGNVSAVKTFTVLVLREQSEERNYVSALAVTGGGTMLVPFRPQQDEYLIYAAPEADSVKLITQLAPGPHRFTVDGASYSISTSTYGLNGLFSASVIDPYSTVAAATYDVTGAVYEVQVRFDKGTSFLLNVQSEIDGAILKTVKFNIVRSLPWLQVAETNETDTEIVLIGREPLQTTAIQASSFRLDGGPAVTGASFDITDPDHRTVRLTLAEPIPSGRSVKLTIDAGLITTTDKVVSFNGYPIFAATQRQLTKQAVDKSKDGLHMDDMVRYLDDSNGDINGDGTFDSYDIELLLKLIDPRSVPSN